MFFMGLIAGGIMCLVGLVFVQGLATDTLKIAEVLFRGLAVLATLLAVVVALFKDDIRKPHITLEQESSDWVQEGAVQTTSNTGGVPGPATMDYVTEYFVNVRVFNRTGISARDCEVRMLNIQTVDGQQLSIDPLNVCSPFPLNPRTDHIIRLFELALPTSSNQGGAAQPIFKVGSTVVPELSKGEWIAKFRFHGANVDAEIVVLKISWDGVWQHRKDRMKLRIERMS